MGLQYGIKEVYNTSLINFATNKPFVFIDYATAATNENSAERTELRGGQGNGLQMTFDHTKAGTFQLSVPMVDLKLLAYLGGEDMVTGATSIYKREELIISGGSATLAQTPVTDTQVIFEMTGLRDNGTEFTKVASAPAAGQYSISGAVLTCNAADNGKKIAVWYQYTTAATAKKIAIKANKFPATVKIVGEGLFRDQETDTDKVCAITVHKAKAQPNFTLTTSASDATTLDITFDMLGVKASNGDLQYIDYVVLA
jgi:fructose-specific component phosphotransferase system IIB-like protein